MTEAAKKQWNPAEQPYRVLKTFRVGNPALHGWHSSVQIFASEEAAIEAFEATRDFIAVRLQFAENAQDWLRSGRWANLRVRKNGKLEDLQSRKRPATTTN